MALDLNDLWGWLQRLIRRVERLESGAALENSSITNGRMRFIGGQLLIDSGGQLTVVGSASVAGTLSGSGDFTWTGPWEFTGPGEISGDVTWTGDVTASGDWGLTGDFTVLPGGKIQVGDMIIDPAGGGTVEFPGGAVVRGQAGNGVELKAGDYVATVRQGYARLGTPSANFEVDGFTGISIHGVVSASGLGTPINTLHVLSNGSLRKSTGL